jgi:hypothetical protein
MSRMTAVMDRMAELIRDAVVATGEVDIQVEPRMILKPTTPSVDVFPGDPAKEFEAAAFGDMAGDDMYTVRARVAVNDYEANQDLLYEFMDEESDLCVPIAILNDPTLGGTAYSVDVRSFSGVVLYPSPDGTVTHIGCQWGFKVIPDRE